MTTKVLSSTLSNTIGTVTSTSFNLQSNNVTALTIDTAQNVSVVGTAYSPQQTLTDGATISWNVQAGQVAAVTLGGNRTLAAPATLQNGAFYALAVIQDATGSRTLTWNSVFKFPSGTAPTLSTAAGAKDFFVFRSDGTNLYMQGQSLAVA